MKAISFLAPCIAHIPDRLGLKSKSERAFEYNSVTAVAIRVTFRRGRHLLWRDWAYSLGPTADPDRASRGSSRRHRFQHRARAQGSAS